MDRFPSLGIFSPAVSPSIKGLPPLAFPPAAPDHQVTSRPGGAGPRLTRVRCSLSPPGGPLGNQSIAPSGAIQSQGQG